MVNRRTLFSIIFSKLILILLIKGTAFSQNTQSPGSAGEQSGLPIYVEPAIRITTSELMLIPNIQEYSTLFELRNKFELEEPDRHNLAQAPGAMEASQWPPESTQNIKNSTSSMTAQTVGLTFNGATGPAETFGYPPDTDGAVGPTQFFVFLNGRLRTFNKTTGIADGVLNLYTENFFSSVMTPGINYCTDPNVRFDRLSNRWFLNIIDVPGSISGSIANKIIIAVSDAASSGVISASTIWTLYSFVGDPNLFTDYQSLGIDAEALYIGANMFALGPGSFISTKGFVIPKAPLLNGLTATVWTFSNLGTVSSEGPFSPRGVDNYDPTNTGPTATGYFIGVDVLAFSKLMIRRITNPGNTSASPAISGNLSITVTTTTNPNPVTHLGNTGGNNGRLSAIDDRLFAAHIRNGRLWTAHNILVSNTGIANTGAEARNAVRWYELNVASSGTPTVVQSGTIFDNTTLLSGSRQYWIPSVMVSGQGHAAIGFSAAGTPFYANAATSGRLVGEALGSTQAVNIYTSSSTSYNPSNSLGAIEGRRWGDYSYTCLDPKDDMTMWTIQEYCNGTNTYGVQVAKLIAPPPATLSNLSPATVVTGQSSVDINITGTSISGSGFYDPGNNILGGTTFNHIKASVSGRVRVNSVTYIDPTHITLNISTVGSNGGLQTVIITNPDGQTISAAILTVITRVSADIKIFLEGPYDVLLAQMKNTINGIILTTSPYIEDPVILTGGIPSTDIIDWVLVELRSTEASSSVVTKKSAFVTKDGNIVDSDGNSPLYFEGVSAGNYFVVIHHRNHLKVMSKEALSFTEI